jgi:hypothetical protein
MSRSFPTLADPSTDAAAMLRRVGFGLVLFAAPVAALFARRAVVVLVPLAIALLVIAAILDGRSRTSFTHIRHLLATPAAAAALVLLTWAGLSLVWTPFPDEAAERLLNIAGMTVLAFMGYMAMPDRTRSANLYFLPIGTALAGIAAMALTLREQPVSEADGQNIERGFVTLVLFLWPSITWLHSRGRNAQALLLAALVGGSTLLAPSALPLHALAVGALAFAVTAIAPVSGAVVMAGIMAGAVLLAPVLPFLLRPLVALLPVSAASGHSLDLWQDVVLNEPFRLVTGHGLETALRAKLVGLLAPEAPVTVLFEIWYELGLVGAAALAVALFAATSATGRERSLLVPGMVASITTAFAFACLGIGALQPWWIGALVVLVLVFVAIERGQFRTKRPKAVLRRG